MSYFTSFHFVPLHDARAALLALLLFMMDEVCRVCYCSYIQEEYDALSVRGGCCRVHLLALDRTRSVGHRYAPAPLPPPSLPHLPCLLTG